MFGLMTLPASKLARDDPRRARVGDAEVDRNVRGLRRPGKHSDDLAHDGAPRTCGGDWLKLCNRPHDEQFCSLDVPDPGGGFWPDRSRGAEILLWQDVTQGSPF